MPILQLALSSPTLSEQQLNDYGLNFVRTQLITVPGAGVPLPYGGKTRQIQVDLDPPALQAKGLSPQDVVNAVSAQNLILPTGTAKIGNYEYDVAMNGSPQTVRELNDLPIKSAGSTTIYIRDVAHVRDGYPPQTNIVRVNSQRASLLTVEKTGDASTLDIVSSIKRMLPQILAASPPGLEITPLADQSLFVRASIQGVLREALIAACLTGFMILVFLGSWRSTLIIAVSIPLSILTSIITLSALGETINIMTLGGLALAVGILWMTPPSKSKTSTGISIKAKRSSRPSWTARSRSLCRLSSRRCVSASSLCRCFFSRAWRASSSFPWPRP